MDQGQPRIAGWTDSLNAVIESPLPLIVFGDHSRTFKYVDEPFARGADGTQLLRPVDEITPLFFFYACRAIDLPSRGYNRHFTLLKEKEISFPRDLAVQQSIAIVLQRAERAVALQDELVEMLEKTKSASMRQLFTQGLHGERQKATEIGPVPESWDVVTIDDVALKTQYGLSVRGNAQGQIPILRMNCQDNGRVRFRDLQYVDLDETALSAFRLEDGDLLFNRTNSIEHVGRTAIFEGATEAVFASYLVRLTVDALRCLPRFLNYYMNRREVQHDIKRLASRAVGQANINATKLRTVAFPLPPSLNEQAEIIGVLDALDRKIDLHRRKREVFDQLFNSLLHKLITGEVSVDDLDLSALPPIEESAA
ncbi:restriction endonuclease subunit S [Mycolicibacterium fortuitum]|uniref:restriction endonuclease subunit S n=1 Tax=Mycolicibacterium fortuitum TaxID=1766 RepID=UPI001A9766BA|nr:restriction endonuclease subunit S [Mycolicibacterium fortuitum]